MMKNKNRTLFVLTALLSAALLSSCGKKTQTTPTAEDLAPFTPPQGFVWEGSYLDKVYDLAVLTIEKDGNGYLCTVSVPDEAITHIESYEFKASPAEDGLGLSYTGGVRTSYLLPAENKPDAGVTTQNIYSDGTGRVFYLDGEVYWMDDKDDAGAAFIFEKVEEEAAVSGNTAE